MYAIHYFWLMQPMEIKLTVLGLLMIVLVSAVRFVGLAWRIYHEPRGLLGLRTSREELWTRISWRGPHWQIGYRGRVSSQNLPILGLPRRALAEIRARLSTGWPRARSYASGRSARRT